MVKTKILVVEDEVIIGEDIRSSLQKMGYDIPSTATTGDEAVRKVREYSPDLVLMDIMIKGEIDGIQTAEKIHSEFNIPIIYLTAYSDDKILERAKITEPFGYLIKPFKERELNIAIEIALFKCKMERILKENREWFVTTLKSISDAVIATDPGGYIKFMNPIAQKLTGWGFEEARGKPLHDVFNVLIEHSGDPMKDQPVLSARDSTKIPIESSSAPIRDDKGQIAGTVFVFRDVTERRRSEDALRRSEEYFRSLIENALDTITILNKDGTIRYESPSIEKVLGYSPGDLTGKMVFDYIHPDDMLSVRNAIDMGMQTPGSTQLVEYRFRHKDGSWHVLESIGKYLSDNSGFSGIIVNSRDVTERKIIEKALQISEEKYRTMIEHSNDMIWTLDRQGNFIYFNKRAEEMSGYNLAEFQGESFAPMIHPEEMPRIQKIFMDTLAGKPQQYEVSLVKKNRAVLVLSVNTAPFFESGEIVGTVSFGRDITERKEAEMLIIETERLAYANEAKSEFLANMSHELRTPLNAIIGFSELLKQRTAGTLNEKQERYVDNVLSSSKHLLNLINDILDLSKVEAGKMELVIEKFSLQNIIDETINLIKEKAGIHNVILEKNYDPGLDLIEADQLRFKQVLFNLLSNAVKFSRNEGGTVTVTTKKEGDMARISVSDTGIGIKEEDINRLFKSFEQLDKGISRNYGGTGLGLAITRKIVELHGGKIMVESKYGEGSIFTFLLPVSAKKEDNK